MSFLATSGTIKKNYCNFYKMIILQALRNIMNCSFFFVFLSAAYLVSILNLLQHVQSCNDNHLLMRANSPEDSPLMMHYTTHLRREM